MNPVAGQSDPGELRALIERRFGEVGLRHELRKTREAGDALCWARQTAGDGTIMEAVSGLIKTGATVPLARLAAGTANLRARALSFPTDADETLATVLNGKAVSPRS